MSVKVRSSLEGLVKEKEYPKLMIGKNGCIVLFTDDRFGTLIQTKDYKEVGHFSSGWAMEYFTDYEGEITLKN